MNRWWPKLVLASQLALAAALLVGLLIVNTRAHAPLPDANLTLSQLRFLHERLERGMGEQMQGLFPEGFYFSWVLFGLGSAQLAAQLPGDHPERQRLLGYSLQAIARLESPAGQRVFPADLQPERGAFYNAWLMYLRAQTIAAYGVASAPPALQAAFRRACRAFAAAIDRNPTPFLQSYRMQSWAVDTGIGIGALGLHDRLFPPEYRASIARWVQRTAPLLERPRGVLPHQSDPQTGAIVENARGGSLAMMVIALAYADPAFARRQYEVLRRDFMAQRAGFPGVLEYPSDHRGSAPTDVDSGPVILGFSGPAVIVGMGAALSMNDLDTARALNGFVEAGGFAVQVGARRFYLAGLLPVGDAFLVWTRTLGPQVPDVWSPRLPSVWSWGLHLASALLAGWIVWRASRLWRRHAHGFPAGSRRSGPG